MIFRVATMKQDGIYREMILLENGNFCWSHLYWMNNKGWSPYSYIGKDINPTFKKYLQENEWKWFLDDLTIIEEKDLEEFR